MITREEGVKRLGLDACIANLKNKTEYYHNAMAKKLADTKDKTPQDKLEELLDVSTKERALTQMIKNLENARQDFIDKKTDKKAFAEKCLKIVEPAFDKKSPIYEHRSWFGKLVNNLFKLFDSFAHTKTSKSVETFKNKMTLMKELEEDKGKHYSDRKHFFKFP